MYTQSYIISPLFILLLIGAVIGIATFFFLLRYRQVPGAKFWLIWQITAAIWAFTYAFEFAATNLDTKIIWSKFSYFGIVYSSVSFLFFSLEYSSSARKINRKIIVGLYTIASLFIISPFTNQFHHLHWLSYSINTETNATNYVYGPFFWIIFIFSYLTLFIGIVNISLLFFRSSGFYKRQILLLFIASLLPLTGNFIYVFHINPVPGFDWTPFTFLLTGILIAINISQFKMFDLVPFARNKLFDILPDAILIVDKTARIADYNPAMRQFINLEYQEIVGKNVEDIFPHRKELIQEIRSKDDFHTILSKEIDGQKHYYDFQALTLNDGILQSNGRLIVLKDITPRVLADEAIKNSNLNLTVEIREKEKLIADLDAFSHTVAHDLKNMLGSIVSASHIIKNELTNLTHDEIMEINDLIEQSATKTLDITKELLTLASVRQQEINVMPVNMEKVINDSIFRLKNMIQSSGALIELPEEWPEVSGYEAWLEEVWINYLSNAIKYGGSPPVIQIKAELLSGGWIKYIVKDNGNGLSEDEMALLFNKFTRLETVRAEGHGLGLSIVKRIIEKLNGEVGVESKNIPGEGSVFYFILPAAINQ